MCPNAGCRVPTQVDTLNRHSLSLASLQQAGELPAHSMMQLIFLIIVAPLLLASVYSAAGERNLLSCTEQCVERMQN